MVSRVLFVFSGVEETRRAEQNDPLARNNVSLADMVVYKASPAHQEMHRLDGIQMHRLSQTVFATA